jgi:hypothetical protein
MVRRCDDGGALPANRYSEEHWIMAMTAVAAIPSATSCVPSTKWQERPLAPDEPALFASFGREIMAQQKKVAATSDGDLLRGFHAKLHAGLRAEFEVMTGLPQHACHGVFAVPKNFPALVRFSNGEPGIHADRHREPRGIAIKLIGVPGRKLLPGQEDAVTQDFLATSHSVTSAVKDVTQFMQFIRAQRNGLLFLPVELYRAVGLSEAWRIVKALLFTVVLSSVRSMVTEHFSSTAPIKLGPYAVKFMVRPAEGTAATRFRLPTKNFLRRDLADRLRSGNIDLDFLIQFYVDDSTPIENTSIAWDTPWLRVAQLRIFSCDLDDPQTNALSEWVNRLSFNPWHATEDHRPLGNVMRARRVVYDASAGLRMHSPEPTGLPPAEG